MLKCYAYVCSILGKTLKDTYNIKKVKDRYSVRSLPHNSRIPWLESTYPNKLKALSSDSGECNTQVFSKVLTQGTLSRTTLCHQPLPAANHSLALYPASLFIRALSTRYYMLDLLIVYLPSSRMYAPCCFLHCWIYSQCLANIKCSKSTE